MLDSTQGHPLQTWTFNHANRITLGRMNDNDIVIADPRVSRAHAYIQLENQSWRIVSLSPLKIYFQGRLVDELPLNTGTVFQLGKQGTSFRFEVREEISEYHCQTINIDSLDLPELTIDAAKMQAEVTEIVEADYFQSLKKQALKLREERRHSF